MMLWKEADQQGPPKVAITQFGREVKGGIPSPCVDTGLPATQGLIDVINCGCKSEDRACSNCHTNNVSCTVYCAYSAANGCYNPYTTRDDAHKNGDEQAEYESE